jgi:hypothetical protein
MFGFEVLDIVIGLMFVYLLLSLLATALNEYISALMNLRGKELARGLGRLLDDLDEKDSLKKAFEGVGPSATAATASLTERFYNHRLIRPLATRRGWLFRAFSKEPRLPSYIPARTFAQALLDVLGYHDAVATDPAVPPAALPGSQGAQPALGAEGAQLANIMKILKLESPLDVAEHLRILAGLPQAADLPPALQAQVASVFAGAQTQLQNLHDGVEVWFNNSMDRVSGAYKRNVQGWLFVIGVLIASCSNADTIDMWHRLASNDELRSAMAKRAAAYVAPPPPASDTTTSDTSASNAGPASNSRTIDTTVTLSSAVDTTANRSTGTDTTTNPPPAASDTTRPPARDTTSTDTSAAAKARKKYLDARADLDSMELKLGWTTAEAQRVGFIKERRDGKPGWGYNLLPLRRAAFWWKLVGLALTAIAISLGAPFWFDMLNKVISIRATGRAPNEKPKSPEGGPKRQAEHTPK